MKNEKIGTVMFKFIVLMIMAVFVLHLVMVGSFSFESLPVRLYAQPNIAGGGAGGNIMLFDWTPHTTADNYVLEVNDKDIKQIDKGEREGGTRFYLILFSGDSQDPHWGYVVKFHESNVPPILDSIIDWIYSTKGLRIAVMIYSAIFGLVVSHAVYTMYEPNFTLEQLRKLGPPILLPAIAADTVPIVLLILSGSKVNIFHGSVSIFLISYFLAILITTQNKNYELTEAIKQKRYHFN